MGDKTGIEWTATVNADGSVTPGATWNPVTGCSKVSPGCANCYAETIAVRFWKTQYPPVVKTAGAIVFKELDGSTCTRPREFTDVQCHEDRLDQPLRWKRPRRVFVNSMSDLFHEDVPDAFIDRVFAVMALASQHTFQILTKRAERMRAYVTAAAEADDVTVAAYEISGETWDFFHSPRVGFPLKNVWLGTSVENQHFADERIPLLLQTPAAVRFLSVEPLLGPVDISMWLYRGVIEAKPGDADYDALQWVIVGGESGPGARPFNVAWARSIVRQCRASRVPVFVKQLGANVRDRNDAGFEGDEPGAWPMDTDTEDDVNGYREEYQGAPVRVRLVNRKGGDMDEWPEDLRVRQFPEAR